MGTFFAILLGLCAAIFLAIAPGWLTYKKAGKPGWAYIVPIYSTIVWLEIIKKPLWWFFLLLVPGLNLVILIIMYNGLANAFGKGVGFTLGLLFLPFIFLPILGFGKSQYQLNEAC